MNPNDRHQRYHSIFKYLLLLGTMLLGGCQEFLQHTVTASPDAPFPIPLSSVLTPSPQDTKFLETLGRESEKQLSQCPKSNSCSHAHFLRALTILHHNQELAIYHFQKVVAAHSKSQLGQASRIWLWLLDEISRKNEDPASINQITRGLVQALLAKDIALVEEADPANPPTVTALQKILTAHETKVQALSEQLHDLTQQVSTFKNETASIQALRQELKARDKKVERLTSQLDALRRIDQELKEKAAPTKPSETIIPPKEELRDSP